MSAQANPPAAVAPELPSHGYVITRPVPGSGHPMDLTFVLTRDEIYVPIVVRKPAGAGPFPVIVMGRGAGRGGLPHIEKQVQQMVPMQDEMIARGYVVVFVNYRNEIPHLYQETVRAKNLEDDVSGGENRTLKSAPTLDSDDLIAVIRYLQTLAYIDGDAIGVVGVSHSGEMILKIAAEISFAAGVAIEGASHEFLSVDTGPTAPRKGNEIQYQDIEVVRKNANKARAMERIRRIRTPILHIGREADHLQGIFRLAHQWMQEAGKDTTWVSLDHPVHGYPFMYRNDAGHYAPDPIQRKAFELFMEYFDRHLKRKR
ncbi:MAG TPA: prolyl oligopeptidase family serine peptidase [Burkholderiales bacterium]|jgi:dienelactone hydrolase|nr:prolyl oligopeptidase family serine peptidase [Burkholderiales bacterium]